MRHEVIRTTAYGGKSKVETVRGANTRVLEMLMKKSMNRLLRWLFPSYYGPFAKCAYCRKLRLKTDMIGADDSWFCNEYERAQSWLDNQW